MEPPHTQKENVDTNVEGGTAADKVNITDASKLSAPKRGFVIHDDAHSKQRDLKENTFKSRRVLGDISNNQQSRSTENRTVVAGSREKRLGKRSKKLSTTKRMPLSPLRAKTGAPLSPKPQPLSRSKVRKVPTSKVLIKSPHADEVPNIELAFGGLPSPKSESAYMKGLRDEIWHDIITDQTPALFDDFDPAHVVDDWDDSREKAMLESGDPLSLWWSSPDSHANKEAEEFDMKQLKSGEKQVADDINDLPPPDNLADDAVADADCDLLLEDILSVDVEAACSE